MQELLFDKSYNPHCHDRVIRWLVWLDWLIIYYWIFCVNLAGFQIDHSLGGSNCLSWKMALRTKTGTILLDLAAAHEAVWPPTETRKGFPCLGNSNHPNPFDQPEVQTQPWTEHMESTNKLSAQFYLPSTKIYLTHWPAWESFLTGPSASRIISKADQPSWNPGTIFLHYYSLAFHHTALLYPCLVEVITHITSHHTQPS